MNGFIKVKIITEAGEFICWQKVEDGLVVGYVDNTGALITLPKVYEAECVTGDLTDSLVIGE